MINKIFTLLFLGLIKIYKYLISPIIPKACRFLPTCSDYMTEAIKTHGPFYGVCLGIKRLLRCHPFSKHSGIDNVPLKK